MSNREIASLFWFLTLMVFAIYKNPRVIESLRSLCKILFSKKPLILFGFIAIYTAMLTLLLHFLGYWELSLLKGTILWIGSVGIVALFKVCDYKANSNFFKKLILSNIALIVVVQFICGEYTFPLWGEFLIVPFIAFLAMLGVVARNQKDNQVVSKAANFLLVVMGFLILINAVRGAYDDSENLIGMANLKSFTLPIIYSLAFMPLIYLFALYVTYENLATHLSIKFNSEITRKAMWAVLLKYRLSLKGLTEFKEKRWQDLYSCGSYNEIKDVINSVVFETEEGRK